MYSHGALLLKEEMVALLVADYSQKSLIDHAIGRHIILQLGLVADPPDGSPPLGKIRKVQKTAVSFESIV